jgi:hypothetical protein
VLITLTTTPLWASSMLLSPRSGSVGRAEAQAGCRCKDCKASRRKEAFAWIARLKLEARPKLLIEWIWPSPFNILCISAPACTLSLTQRPRTPSQILSLSPLAGSFILAICYSKGRLVLLANVALPLRFNPSAYTHCKRAVQPTQPIRAVGISSSGLSRTRNEGER